MASCEEDWQTTKNTVLERNQHMFNNPFFSDVTFTCEGSDTKFYAHKYVLVTSSAVFYAEFNGESAEDNSNLQLSKVNEQGLQEFLRFLYTDKCKLTTDNAVMVPHLANRYEVSSLARKCTEFIEGNITVNNLFTLLQQAIHFEEIELENKFWSLVDKKTSTAVKSKAFTELNQGTLLHFLKRETLKIDEVDLFKAVLKWSEAECSRKEIETNAKNMRDVFENAIYEIRFASFTTEELTENVSGTDLLTPEEMNLFFEISSGAKRTSEIWNMSERGVSLKKGTLRCCRFTGYVSLGNNVGTEHAIGVAFNKAVKIQGVRLLGNPRKKCEVKFEVSNQKVKQKQQATDDDCDVYGFDVMLRVPVKVKANEHIHLKATVKGSKGASGYGGKAKIKTNGVTLTFFNSTGFPNNETSVECGQFDQIIFSRC